MDRHDKRVIMWCGLAVVALFGAMFLAEKHDSDYKQTLMDQCKRDGKPEYECYALVHGHDSKTIIVPAPIYTGR